MAVIEVRDLTKVYQVYRKRAGLFASIGGLFHREYNEVHAVAGVSFQIEEGEMVAFLGPTAPAKPPRSSCLPG